MKRLLSLLLFCTLSPGLLAQGVAVRSNGGVETNGTFYGLSTFRGSSGTVRLLGESSAANKKDYRIASGADTLQFLWVNDALNSLLFLGTADSQGNWSFNGHLNVGTNVTAASYFGDGSHLTGIASASLGFQPATNSLVGIITPLGYTPLTNTAAAINNALGYVPATNGVLPAASTNAHASATNSLDLGKKYADFSATSAMAITNFSNVDPAAGNGSVLLVTNGSGSNLVLYLQASVTTLDGARSVVLTNNTLTVFSFSVYGRRFTNCAYRTFY